MHYRTGFISDTHFGAQCAARSAPFVLKILQENTFETLYLVGDILDLWAMGSLTQLSSQERRVIRHLSQLSQQGTQIVYIPGNHDNHMRRYLGRSFGGILIAQEAIHQASNGKKYLVLHGDEFDFFMHTRWRISLANVLGSIYDKMVALQNRWGRSRARNPQTKKKHTITQLLKHGAKIIAHGLSLYDRKIRAVIREEGVDGVISGHTHWVENRGYRVNIGDTVESMTILVELADGRLDHLYDQPCPIPDEKQIVLSPEQAERYSGRIRPSDRRIPSYARVALEADHIRLLFHPQVEGNSLGIGT